MPASLLDVNVWLAGAFEAHPGHRSARKMLLQATAVPNQYALAALQEFQALPPMDLIDEPIGIELSWWRLAGIAAALTKS